MLVHRAGQSDLSTTTARTGGQEHRDGIRGGVGPLPCGGHPRYVTSSLRALQLGVGVGAAVDIVHCGL